MKGEKNMIESICMKNIATFDSNDGVKIEGLTKVNFIYGANGCGKTTVSNFLQNPVDGKFSNCTANWKNEAPLKALVYNKIFREQNFGKGKLNGVFTLGQATSKEIKVIEDKIEQLKTIKEDGQKKREIQKIQTQKKEVLENDFKETC